MARRKTPRNPHLKEKRSAPVQMSINGGGGVAADGKVQLDVRLERETVWLTQAQMAELVDVSDPLSRSMFEVCFGKGTGG